MNNVTVVFTFKSVERLKREGGTSSWRLDRNHARSCEFAVCTRNAKSPRSEGAEPHQSAFMVGKVKDVVPTADRKGRYLIQFSEYALVSVPEVWKGDRNPIRYASSLHDLGIDSSTLKWKPMPDEDEATTPEPQGPGPGPKVTPLTMAEAKNGLAFTLGVPPDAIEFTIRG